MAVTDGAAHTSADIGNLRQQESGFGEAEVLVSGNDVNLEQELLKSGEVNAQLHDEHADHEDVRPDAAIRDERLIHE